MKKLIILLIFSLLFVSCVNKKENDSVYCVTYKIYYPGNTVTKEYSFGAIKDEASANVWSSRGSNHLIIQRRKKGGFDTIESTTAPIEILRFEEKY